MTVKLTSSIRENILWVQWIGGTGSMLMLLMAGILAGSTSPHLAQLTADDSPIPINLDEASWMASLMNLGRLIGAIPGAMSVYFFSSKKTLLFNGGLWILSWVAYIVADSAAWLYVGRFCGGFAVGVTFVSFPLYLGEVSSLTIRGALVTYATIGLPVGTVLGNAIGAYVSIPTFGSIGLVGTIIIIFIFIWVPESPHHLISLSKIEEAKKSIARYNPGANIEMEIKSLQDFVNASKSITIASKLREFNIPANRKAGFIVVMLYIFLQFGGANTVFFYLEIILTSGGLTVVPSATMVIVAGVVGTASAFVAIYLSDKFGRRIMWNVSSLGVTVMLAVLGAHFALLSSGINPAGLQWLMISSILAIEVFLFLGVCSIPHILLSELVAPNIKSMAACFASFSVGLFSFIVSKTYQPILDATNEAILFWIYAAVMGLSLVFGVIFIPETKGKSLQEIQSILHNSK